jgi:hypothetical protein
MAACGSATLLTGLMVNLLVVIFLGEAGWYRPGIEWGLLGAVTSAGLAAAWFRSSPSLRRHAALSLPVSALFAGCVCVALLLPSRGEWVLGGWDPGVYVNEGIALARHGTLHPPDRLFSDSLTKAEKKVFTRTGHRRTERFPGVVVDSGKKAFTFEFYRLLPSMIALAYRTGGLPAAVRVNTILGGLALLILAAVLWRGSGGPHAFFATVLLALQPVWLYHTHTPVTEMLQLVLILGAGVLLPARSRSWASSLLLSLLLSLLVLNRFSFVPFAGIFIFILALTDSGREDRRRVWGERLLQIGAVLAAAGIDTWIAPYSARGWRPFPPIFEVFGLCVLAALAVDALSARKTFRSLSSRIPDRARWTAGVLAVAVTGGVLSFATEHLPVRADPDNLFHLASFAGWPVLAAAAAGGLIFFCTMRNAPAAMKGLFLFLAVVGTLLLVQNWIRDIYPWAMRRSLPYAVPAAAVLAGYLPAQLWRGGGRLGPARKGAALLLVLALCLSVSTKSRNAWSRVEYEGISAALSAVAQKIDERDIVIADDPRWGTPLVFIYGRQVLNGKHFWRRRSTREMELGLRGLNRLREEGRRIRFLTTTETKGLAIYPLVVEPVVLDWESGPFVLEEIVHSSRATNFVTREKTYNLRLFTWHPDR